MTDVHTQVNHLKRQIDTGAEETKQYLATLKKRVAEYDTHNKFSENASAYMQSGIDSAMKSVDELREIGTQLQAQTKTASDETICTAQNSLHKVNKALLALQEKAREYDRKFTNSKGSSVVEGIENVVNSTRQRATDGIEMASEQATRVKDMIGHKAGQVANKAGEVAGGAKYTAQVATGETVRAAEVVDEKVGVTPLVQSAVGGVTETVKNLDKRMHVSETAAKIDAKVTGGLGAKVVNKGVEMVQESIEYVTESLQHAKIVASQSPTVQKAESQVSGVAQQASDTTGAAGDKVTAAKDQAKQTMCDARQKAAETAAYAHDTAVGMATSAKEKVMGATDHTKDMAGQTADMAKARGAQASDTAHHMAGSAQQTGHDMKEGAKEKGTEMKDRTMDRAGQLGTSVKEATMGTSSGESATDKMHRTAYERQQRPNEGYLGQAASKAEQIARDTKEKMADTQSRQKSVMKDTTHA